MTNKEQYRVLCREEKSIPLFCQDWWLDAVCIEQWDVLLVKDKDLIVGALPYHIRSKFGLKCIIQPQLTQHNGVWIQRQVGATECAQLSAEKKIFNELINQLEALKLSFYQQCFHLSITNWLPFYWRGYQQTTRYTYVIPSIGNSDKVFSRFSSAKQRQIRKCESQLSISLEMTPNEFYSHHKQSLKEKGEEISYSFELFLRIYKAALQKGAGQLFAIKDKEGNVHSCLFCTWNHVSAYALLYSISPKHASSGASTLVIWEAIKFLSGKTRSFDFEGSMIEGIENSYRQFGTVQKPYFKIEKFYSRTVKLLYSFCKRDSL